MAVDGLTLPKYTRWRMTILSSGIQPSGALGDGTPRPAPDAQIRARAQAVAGPARRAREARDGIARLAEHGRRTVAPRASLDMMSEKRDSDAGAAHATAGHAMAGVHGRRGPWR